MEIIQHKPNDFAVISGDDAFTLPFIAMGMQGVISVIANAYPKQFSQMIQHCLNNEFEAAKPLHYQLLDAMNLIFADGSPGGIKVILNAMGICETTVRKPLHQVSDSVREKLLKGLLA